MSLYSHQNTFENKIPFLISAVHFHVPKSDLRGYESKRSKTFLFELDDSPSNIHSKIHTNVAPYKAATQLVFQKSQNRKITRVHSNRLGISYITRYRTHAAQEHVYKEKTIRKQKLRRERLLQRILTENHLPKESRPDYKTLFSLGKQHHIPPYTLFLAIGKKEDSLKIPHLPYVELEPMDFDNPPPSSSQAAMTRSLRPHKGVDYKRLVRIFNRPVLNLISQSRDDYINNRFEFFLSHFPFDFDVHRLVLPITGFSNASSPTFKGKLTVDSFDESMDYSRQKFFLNHKKFPDHIDPLSRVGYLFTRLVICRHNPANIHVSEVVNYKHSSPIISMLSASFGFNFRLNFSPIISQELTILQTIEMEAAYNYVNSDYSLLVSILTNFQDDVHAIHSNKPISTLSKHVSEERRKFMQSQA
ncbi:hypothetical protein C1645_835822, partial [Glomus cerebriforme]